MTSVWLRNALGQSSVSCGHVGEVPPGLCISSSPASSHPTTAAQASPGAQDHPTFILSITTPPPPPLSGWQFTAPGPYTKEGRGLTLQLKEQALP